MWCLAPEQRRDVMRQSWETTEETSPPVLASSGSKTAATKMKKLLLDKFLDTDMQILYLFYDALGGGIVPLTDRVDKAWFEDSSCRSFQYPLPFMIPVNTSLSKLIFASAYHRRSQCAVVQDLMNETGPTLRPARDKHKRMIRYIRNVVSNAWYTR